MWQSEVPEGWAQGCMSLGSYVGKWEPTALVKWEGIWCRSRESPPSGGFSKVFQLNH